MDKITDALVGIPAEQQMVIVSGVLGNILSKCGPNPSKTSAILFAGSAINMVFDMIARNFDGPRT